jgi:hypothetical protein
MRCNRLSIGCSIALSACGGGMQVAQAVHADSSGVRTPLSPPVNAAAGPRVVCLEFAPPGESRRIAELVLVLGDSRGDSDTLRGLIDRTGEATICLRDSIPSARTYTSISARADRPLTVRRLVWRSPRDSVRAAAP